MRFSYLWAAAPIALGLCVNTANAATFNVSGFGTAAFAISDTDKAEFVRDMQVTGADSEGDVGVDSRAAVQVTAQLDERLSASVQLMLRRRFESDLELDVPMAFVKAKATNDLSVRLGRLPLPVFMVSDFRQVGYANTWLRPPVEVYSQVPVDSVDGFDLLYSVNLDRVTLDAQAFYGKSDFNSTGVSASSRKLWGANITATVGPLTLRAGQVELDLTLKGIDFADAIIGGVRAAGFTVFADELTPKGKLYEITSFGANLDWNNFLVQIEHTFVKADGWLPDTRGQYALVGYRTGKFTPYAMYAKYAITSARTSNVIPKVGQLIPLAFAVDALIRGSEQNTTSAGLRWDAAPSVAVKVHYDHVDPEGMGRFANVEPGFEGPVNIFGLAIDVVF